MRSRNRFSARLAFVAGACVVGAIGISAKMVHLTVVRGDELRASAWSEKCRDEVREPYRGSILDRNGVALATTTPASWVSRESTYVYDEAHAPQLASLLGMEVPKLDEILQVNNRFTYLSRGVSMDVARDIRALAISGIGIRTSQQRSYPHGNVAAHVIGFTGLEFNGLEGVELHFNEQIQGKPVTVHVCKDVAGQVFLSKGELSGVNRGASVHLTLDATLQSIAEAELQRQVDATDAAGGAVVMLDPKTGDILAMANSPSYDPNEYSDYPVSFRRNRVVTDLFEPGSTMKPFVIAAALDEGLYAIDDEVFCENGRFRLPEWPKSIGDHHPYGTLSISRIIQVSSNVCTAKIGLNLGPERLYKYLNDFGFDRRSGLPLPGEARGLVPPPEKWRTIRTATVSFGQGISVSALQIASAFGTLANGGMRMVPRIVRSVTDQNGALVEFLPPREEKQVVAPAIARAVTEMMELVVQEGGTATQAAIEGVSVAGKTGTAQKVGAHGYDPNKWVASFVGFLPADDPRVVIVVSIDEPQGIHYGGSIAGPVFKNIAEASLDYLGIQREIDRGEPLAVDSQPEKAPVLVASVLEHDDALADAAAAIPARFDGSMPGLGGLGLRSALRSLDGCDCTVSIEGNGYVVGQDPPAGTVLGSSGVVRLVLGASNSGLGL